MFLMFLKAFKKESDNSYEEVVCPYTAYHQEEYYNLKDAWQNVLNKL